MLPNFALHTTWTCYGTWMPGDERGHVSNVLVPLQGYDPKRNVPGSEVALGDANTKDRASALQKYPTVWLTANQAVCVAETLTVAAKKRNWHISIAAVMANHVHVVTFGCPPDGASVRRVWKGTTQAALSKLVGQSRSWWTDGGSDRYKNDEKAIESAIEYVANQEFKLAMIVDMVVR